MIGLKYHLYDDSLAEHADKFEENYELVNLITSADLPKALLNKENRTCRFCKKKFPAVTFNNDAHIIPHSLGNKHLISDFECDMCNKIFSKYEAQLANYLGITRTLLKTKGKNGIPSFNSPGNVVTAKTEQFFNIKDAINIAAGKNLKIDAKNGFTSVEFDKNPYKPLQVFKAIIRIGFCMISDKDLEYYSDYISRFLIRSKNDKECKGHPAYNVYASGLPMPHNTFAILFKRKSELLIPAHVLLLFTGNAVFQLMMPFHKDDVQKYSPEFSVMLMPPIHFNGEYIENKTVKTREFNMSDIELIKEKGYFSFNFDPSSLNNVMAYDPATNTHIRKKFNPNEIVGIKLIEKNQKIKFPDADKSSDKSLNL